MTWTYSGNAVILGVADGSLQQADRVGGQAEQAPELGQALLVLRLNVHPQQLALTDVGQRRAELDLVVVAIRVEEPRSNRHPRIPNLPPIWEDANWGPAP